MTRSPRSLTAVMSAVAVSAALLGAAGCAQQRPCAGQCGPPFQLQVIFRAGTSPRAATAALNRCAGNPLVVRVGRVESRPSAGAAARLRQATVYTHAITRRTASHQLVTCLLRSPAVLSAGYPD
jgi:hypothetical protein